MSRSRMLLKTLPAAEAKPVPKSKNKKLCQNLAIPPCDSMYVGKDEAILKEGSEFQSAIPAKKPTAVLNKTKKVILGFVISRYG